MSISTEITRLTSLRNSIRTKLISLGIISNSSAALSDCYSGINSVSKQTALTKNGGTVSGAAGYYPNAVSQTVTASDVDTMGTKSITANGTHDVIGYSSVEVCGIIPNMRAWEVTLESELTSTVKIASADAWALAHRTDTNLACTISRSGLPPAPSSGNYVYRSANGNYDVGGSFGCLCGISNAGTANRNWIYGNLTNAINASLSIDSNGDVYMCAGTTNKYAAGKYRCALYLV